MARSVPARAIKDKQGMNVFSHIPGEIRQIRLHHIAIHPRKQAGVRVAAGWANRAEQVNPFIFGLPIRTGAASSLGPYPRQRPLLAEAGLILKPQLDLLVPLLGSDAPEGIGQSFF